MTIPDSEIDRRKKKYRDINSRVAVGVDLESPTTSAAHTIIECGTGTGTELTAGLEPRKATIFQLLNENTVMVASSFVASTGSERGLKLSEGDSLTFSTGTGITYFGISVGTGTGEVAVQEIG